MIGRRPLLLAALATGMVPRSLRAIGVSTIAFKVLRNGRPLGQHQVRIEHTGDEIRIGIDIRLDVRFAFIPVYAYRHRNDEVWRGGRLQSLDTTTDDNGTPHRVQGRAAGGRFLVESSAGSLDLPAGIMPTSYWHPDSLARDRWLDTQSGRLIEARVELLGPEQLEAGGHVIEAERFRLDGDLALDIWYRNGAWVGLRFSGPDGSVIDYALESEPVLARL
jgi:hypothetical protein